MVEEVLIGYGGMFAKISMIISLVIFSFILFSDKVRSFGGVKSIVPNSINRSVGGGGSVFFNIKEGAFGNGFVAEVTSLLSSIDQASSTETIRIDDIERVLSRAMAYGDEKVFVFDALHKLKNANRIERDGVKKLKIICHVE